MPSERASINHFRSIFFFLFKGCRKFFFNLLKINRIFHFLKQNLKKLSHILPDFKPLRHHPPGERTISAATRMQDCRVPLLLLPGRYLCPLPRWQQLLRRWSPSLLTAQNMAFDAKTLTAPAGSTVVMTFVNNDNNMPHNFALYTDSSAMTKIFVGDYVTGPKTITYTFTVPSKPGNYFFRCDIHPELMTGTFIVP